jgi:hypothetical protein
MTPQQIGKVWVVISVFLLYYALNTWIVTQGGNEILGAKLIVTPRIPAAMMGIPICSILLVITSLIGKGFAERTGARWHSRVPILGFESIDTCTREGKLYQGAVITLLSLLPGVSLIHFWRLFATAHVVTTKNPPERIDSIWSWSALTKLDDPARICTDFNETANKISCEGNITILPGLEPTVFAVLTGFAVIAIAFHWRALFFKQSQEVSACGPYPH